MAEQRQVEEEKKNEKTSIRATRFFDDLIEPIRQILEHHGARLEVLHDACIIHVPTGTTRERLYPHVHTDRYEIRFPDGYIFYEAVGSVLSGESRASGVSFVVDDFPVWVQRKYR